MAADRDLWVKRVSAWQASGRTAKEFSRGQEYAESALRYWATRLRKEAQAKQEGQGRHAPFASMEGQNEAPKKARLARVIPRAQAPTVKDAATSADHTAGSISNSVGAVQVLVKPFFLPEAQPGELVVAIEERALDALLDGIDIAPAASKSRKPSKPRLH